MRLRFADQHVSERFNYKIFVAIDFKGFYRVFNLVAWRD